MRSRGKEAIKVSKFESPFIEMGTLGKEKRKKIKNSFKDPISL